jgi:arylsulfatase A-like enzyme
MEEFINDRTFDEIALSLDGSWPERDRLVLRGELPRLLQTAIDRPKFIVSFVMSSHHEYRYPKEYERHLPVIENYSLSDPNLSRHRDRLFNRYRNALTFLDDELAAFLNKLDPERNLIIVTGDHGESFWDDGRFLHASLGSDAQMRVPLVMVGPGIPRGRIKALTRHMDILPTILHALAGRHVPLEHTHGRDALVPGFQNDHLVLFPYRGPQAASGLVLIHHDRRVRVRLWFSRRTVQMEGYSDIHDHLDDTIAPRPGELEQWQQILLEELHRISS